MRYLLIPAAGESLRFAQEGFFGPKALLPVRYKNKTRSMLGHTLDNLVAAVEPTLASIKVTIVLGCSIEHKPAFEKFFEDWKSRNMTKIDYVILGFTQKSRGQSETLHWMIRDFQFREHEYIGIINSDMYFSTSLFSLMMRYTTPVVFVSEETPEEQAGPPIYSYFRRRGKFGHLFIEKKRAVFGTPNLFQIGVWLFDEPEVLEEAIRLQLELEHTVRGEYYFSGALNLFNERLLFEKIPRRLWADFGTPEKVRESGAKLIL